MTISQVNKYVCDEFSFQEKGDIELIKVPERFKEKDILQAIRDF